MEGKEGEEEEGEEEEGEEWEEGEEGEEEEDVAHCVYSYMQSTYCKPGAQLSMPMGVKMSMKHTYLNPVAMEAISPTHQESNITAHWRALAPPT